ncbi:3-deoxy-manno-octulosonate cytidylyltransferase [Candidatus Magnetaquicoccaceae bacterium FCR-1]|uniref:3-deoxy-manno-octulosonate cytidylyltransferase n=1 Tax=Candidatus Magnetaquiglobus chichijimensis TaxID=3141448 RepID=A0ABQ0C6G7_9PROT
MTKGFAVIIPARFASTRLPGKPLVDLGGKPMIQWVCEAAARSAATTVLVATDDARIFDAVTGFGGRAVMTSPDHPSGTDRVAEAALGVMETVIVNVQGDEPFLDPRLIDRVAAPLLDDPALPMSTLAHPLTSPDEVFNPNVVKVTCNRRGDALYFSRAPIPWERDRFGSGGLDFTVGLPKGDPRLGGEGERTPSCRFVPEGMLRHVGLYGFRADFLQRFATLAPTPLERIEKLEQLRVLEHGHAIRVVVADVAARGGIDSPEDLEQARRFVAAERS